MIKLETGEYFCLLNALNVTKDCYLKLNQPARAAEARQLFDLLFSAGGDSVYLNTESSLQPERLKEELQKREARLKGEGAVVIAFPGSIDEDEDED